MKNFDSKEPSKGLGDTIAKFTQATGIAKVVEVVTEVLGIEECGCSRRQNTLNNLVPYRSETQSAPTYNPNDYPLAEVGVYEVLKQINASKGGQSFQFLPGDKIWLTEEHSLYSDWPYYILIEAVKKQ